MRKFVLCLGCVLILTLSSFGRAQSGRVERPVVVTEKVHIAANVADDGSQAFLATTQNFQRIVLVGLDSDGNPAVLNHILVDRVTGQTLSTNFPQEEAESDGVAADTDRGTRVSSSGKGMSVNIAKDGVQVFLSTTEDFQKIILVGTDREGHPSILNRIVVDRTTGQVVTPNASQEDEVGGVAGEVACASNQVGGVCCLSSSAGISRMVCTCCVSMSCTICLNIVLS